MNYAKRVIGAVKDKYSHEPEFVQSVTEVLESLGEYLEANPKYEEAKILERLVEPDRIVEFEAMGHKAYRVQFNNTLGPYKGGLRFHPSVNVSILKFLGFEQIFKNALTGLPLGAGKGGSNFNPKGKTDEEVEEFARAFMHELKDHIGARVDVPAGDIGVGAREIKAMLNEYLKTCTEDSCYGAITGKAIEDRGSHIRTEATGYGLVYFVREMTDLAGKRVMISGSGNVAQYAAEKCIELGAKVITMSDSGGYVVAEDGLAHEQLQEIMELKNKKRGRLSELDGYHEGSVWQSGLAVDIALPCATQNEIDEVSAKLLVDSGIELVAEGANMPSTKEAVDVFVESGVKFGPAKACNAGGVAVSGLEMEQNSLGEQWSREEVDARLQSIMKDIHSSCVREGGEDLVKGANIAGFKRVADKMLESEA